MKNIITIIIVTCIALWAATQLIGAKYVATAASISLYVIVPAVAFWAAAVAVAGPVGKIGAFFITGRESRSASKAKESAAKKIAAEAERIKAEARRIDREADVSIRKIETETKRIEAEAWAKLAEARKIVSESRHRMISGNHVLVLDNQTGRVQQYLAPPKKMLLNQEQQWLEEDPQYTVIDIISRINDRMRGTKNAPRFIFAGPTRAGKTFTAMRVTEIIDAEYYALDPKAADPEESWPDCVKVVGQGDNWEQMGRFFIWIMQREQPRRAELMESHPAAFKRLPKIIIFLEELLSTLMARPEFAGNYITILTKYAQFGIGIIPITHATTATAMGFKPGMSELKNCFDAVFRFDYDILSDTRKSYVTLRGQDEMELAPYRNTGNNCNTGNRWQPEVCNGLSDDIANVAKVAKRPILLAAPAEKKYHTTLDRDICQSYMGGSTLYSICTGILKKKPGGNHYETIRRVLAKYGITERRA